MIQFGTLEGSSLLLVIGAVITIVAVHRTPWPREDLQSSRAVYEGVWRALAQLAAGVILGFVVIFWLSVWLHSIGIF